MTNKELDTVKLMNGLQDKMRRYRLNKDITQKQLANKLGITRSMVAMIENNQTMPAFDTGYKIMKLLQIEVKDL